MINHREVVECGRRWRPVILGILLTACHPADNNLRQGYIEGEFVYIAPPLPGVLETLAVQRGDTVEEGALLYILENDAEILARDEAAANFAQARALLEDAKKGKRPAEVDALEAQIRQARAALDFSEKDLSRKERLHGTAGETTEQDVDRARSTRDQDRQRVAQLEAELETASLGARDDQVAAAESRVRALEAAVARAEWELSRKRLTAPQGGRIHDTLFRAGEWVAAGRPVVVLLPPAQVKLRAYVPQPWLSDVQVGDPVDVRIDGASSPVTGRISFISSQAEYTPPVIYSRENREKLVFLVEAVFEPDVAARLHPGQPVDVRFDLSRRP